MRGPRTTLAEGYLREDIPMKTWFITGASKGFGREWAEAALERGDRVAATARDSSALDALVERHGDAVLPLRLDVTDRDAGIAAVQQAAERFGSLDVVVNNAGFGQFGAIEEITEDEARGQFETNVFGALWITQAAVAICASRDPGTSCRSRASAASARSPTPASTTRRSGRSRASASRCRSRWRSSGST